MFGSFFMLLGVAICSYTMGELNDVLMNTLMMDEEAFESQLDSFFALLKHMNRQIPIDADIIKEIS